MSNHDHYRYRPITDRDPGSWPGGRRLAVYIALGLEEYRLGQGHTEDLIPGVDGIDVVNTSWRDYGNRVGGFRILDRLAGLDLPVTVLINTALYDTAPELLAHARRYGAEFVGHGVTNSDSLADMTPTEQDSYTGAVAERIEREEGVRPRGWSSPWLTQTAHTPAALVGSGYRYLLDLRADDRLVPLAEPGLTAIPYALELNDSSTIIGRGASASEFADMIIDEFDELLAASQEQPLVMSVVVHSFISGAPFRLRQLTRALEHLARHRDQVWFTQPGHIWDASHDE
jgi:peptidoglycan/xylan/chitin deacetylase (PgdA/CDA1 family)